MISVIIGSGNGLLPGWCQAMSWISTGLSIISFGVIIGSWTESARRPLSIYYILVSSFLLAWTICWWTSSRFISDRSTNLSRGKPQILLSNTRGNARHDIESQGKNEWAYKAMTDTHSTHSLRFSSWWFPNETGDIYWSPRPWRRHQMEIFSALLVFYEAVMKLPGWNYLSISKLQRWIPLTKASDAELWYLSDLRLNKRLIKQARRRWFETHRANYDVTIIGIPDETDLRAGQTDKKFPLYFNCKN